MKANVVAVWHPAEVPKDYQQYASLTFWSMYHLTLLLVCAPPMDFGKLTPEAKAQAIGDAITTALRDGVLNGRIPDFRGGDVSY